MILADAVMAVHDPLDPMAELQVRLRRAERFVFDVAAAKAAVDVARTKPSSLLSAIALRRAPFPVTWIEYPHKDMLLARGEQVPEPAADAAVPVRIGFLIERWEPPAGGPPTDVATIAWTTDKVVGVLPAAIEMGTGNELTGHVDAVVALRAALSGVSAPIQDITVDDARQVAASAMAALPDAEIEAALRLYHEHTRPYVSPCYLGYLLAHQAAASREGRSDTFFRQWREDWNRYYGYAREQAHFLTAALLLLNSRNAAAVEREDLSRLNRARVRSGKLPLLDRSTVRISLSAVQARRAYGPSGVASAAKRLHLVRGHFKVKKRGVYWWNAHLRGDPASGRLDRERYQVVSRPT